MLILRQSNERSMANFYMGDFKPIFFSLKNIMFVNGEQTFLDRDDSLYEKLGIEDRVFKTDEGVKIHFHYELDDEGRYYLRIDKINGLKGKESDKRLQQLKAITFFWSCEVEEFLDHVVDFYSEVF